MYTKPLANGMKFLHPASQREIEIITIQVSYDRVIKVFYVDSIFGPVDNRPYDSVITMLGNGYVEVKE